IPGTEWKTMVWVGGDIVTWVDYRNYDSATVDSLNSEIYLYNLATSQEKRVTTDHKYQEKPVTDGQRVAWVDYSAGYGKVFVHTISSGSTAEKGAFAAGKNTPRIDGNTLVWEDYRNAVSNKKNIDIYLCNLATDAVKPICVAANFQGRPFVSGDLVVWEDYRNATAADSMNSDIYGYRISSGTEFALVSGAGYQGHPTLRGDTLCWIEYSGTTIKLMTKVIVSTGSRTGHDNPNRSPITISRSADNRLFVAGALPAQKLNVSIMDMSGRCIIRKNLRTSYNGSAEIAGNAGNGIYVVTVRPDNGAAITETHALYR
nr:hypothetical protein [Chitinispirillaceae bacterium]